MRKSFLVISSLLLLISSSCVSSKVYKDLEAQQAQLKEDYENLQQDFEAYRQEREEAYNLLLEDLKKSEHEQKLLQEKILRTEKRFVELQDSYDALQANSSSALAENSERNRELLREIEEKEKALAAERERLEQLQEDLSLRSRRIEELESVIAAKDQKMSRLKDAISKALVNFEGRGLTVEQRDGKVYVSMENKLLFDSGSWAVGQEGRTAVEQLGAVLADNPDIAVLIEGHTDNVPYNGSGSLEGNWDLSTKRATSIVKLLLENPGIDPESLTAAGKGEHAPVASNGSSAGRAKNRRIEVVLTPKLDEIEKLLQEVE